MNFDTAKLIASITFSVLILAFSHEWAYFSIVGEHFQSAMGVYDYFQASILWLPYLAIALFIYALMTLLEYRARHFNVRPPFSENWFIDYFRADRTMFFFGIVFLLGGAVGFFVVPLGSDLIGMIELPLFFLWGIICAYIFSNTRVKEVFTIQMVLAMIFAPMLLLIAVFGGFSDGYKDLQSFTRPYKIKFATNDESYVQLLRVMDRGLLAREGEVFRFYKWDEVKSFSRVVQSRETRTMACRLLSYFCSKETAP